MRGSILRRSRRLVSPPPPLDREDSGDAGEAKTGEFGSEASTPPASPGVPGPTVSRRWSFFLGGKKGARPSSPLGPSQHIAEEKGEARPMSGGRMRFEDRMVHASFHFGKHILGLQVDVKQRPYEIAILLRPYYDSEVLRRLVAVLRDPAVGLTCTVFRHEVKYRQPRSFVLVNASPEALARTYKHVLLERWLNGGRLAARRRRPRTDTQSSQREGGDEAAKASPRSDGDPNEAPGRSATDTLECLDRLLDGDCRIQRVEFRGLIQCILPLHDDAENRRLLKLCITHRPSSQKSSDTFFTSVKRFLFSPAQVTELRDHFGDDVGWYYAWIAHVTNWLIPPAAAGIVVCVLAALLKGSSSLRGVHSFVLVGYAVALQLWFAMMMRYWKRQRADYEYEWDIAHTVDPVSSTFYGVKTFNAETRRWEITYSKWKRWAKMLVGAPIILAFGALSLVVVMGMFFLEVQWNFLDNGYDQPKGIDFGWITFLVPRAVPGIFLGIFVAIMRPLTDWVTHRLTIWENHKFESEFRRHKIVKAFIFFFLFSFGPFLVNGLVYVPLGPSFLRALGLDERAGEPNALWIREHCQDDFKPGNQTEFHSLIAMFRSTAGGAAAVERCFAAFRSEFFMFHLSIVITSVWMVNIIAKTLLPLALEKYVCKTGQKVAFVIDQRAKSYLAGRCGSGRSRRILISKTAQVAQSATPASTPPILSPSRTARKILSPTGGIARRNSWDVTANGGRAADVHGALPKLAVSAASAAANAASAVASAALPKLASALNVLRGEGGRAPVMSPSNSLQLDIRRLGKKPSSPVNLPLAAPDAAAKFPQDKGPFEEYKGDLGDEVLLKPAPLAVSIPLGSGPVNFTDSARQCLPPLSSPPASLPPGTPQRPLARYKSSPNMLSTASGDSVGDPARPNKSPHKGADASNGHAPKAPPSKRVSKLQVVETSTDKNLTAIYDELDRWPFETFDDLGQNAVQLGFVVFFSAAVPWMSVIFLVWNIIELRASAFKMVYQHSRIQPRHRNTLGPWMGIVAFISHTSSVLSIAILVIGLNVGREPGRLDQNDAGDPFNFLRIIETYDVWHSDVSPTMQVAGMLVFALLLERVASILVVIMLAFIPEENPSLARRKTQEMEIRRLEYLRLMKGRVAGDAAPVREAKQDKSAVAKSSKRPRPFQQLEPHFSSSLLDSFDPEELDTAMRRCLRGQPSPGRSGTPGPSRGTSPRHAPD